MMPRLEARPSPLPQSLQARHARPLPDQVALTVRIDTLDALNLRLALHRELGGRIGVYVLSVDPARAQSILQLQCDAGQLDALMHAVMSGLPRAEFGPMRAVPAPTER